MQTAQISALVQAMWFKSVQAILSTEAFWRQIGIFFIRHKFCLLIGAIEIFTVTVCSYNTVLQSTSARAD
jgi:hypothetical protein